MQIAAYEPDIIAEAAARLYTRAASLPRTWAILCGVAAAVIVGVGLAILIDPKAFLVGLALGAAGGAVAGWLAGKERAFFLRLEAQRMLVLVQIEINGRPR